MGETELEAERLLDGAPVPWQRRWKPLLGAVPALAALLFVTTSAGAASVATQGSRRQRCLRWASPSRDLGLWSIRSEDPKHRPVIITECVFDTTLAATYLAQGSMELSAATIACPKIGGAEASGSGLSASSYRPLPLTAQVDRRMQEVSEDTLAQWRRTRRGKRAHWREERRALREHAENVAQQARNILHRAHEAGLLRDAPRNRSAEHLQGGPAAQGGFNESMVSNASHRQNLTRRSSNRTVQSRLPDYQESENKLKKLHSLHQVVNERRICAAQISGFMGGLGWTAAYLAAATSECTMKVWQERNCASDISRFMAAAFDISQGISGVLGICSQDSPDERRLKKLPGDPRDELLASLAAEEKEAQSQEAEEEEEEEGEEPKALVQAICAVNTAMAAQFIGRAALEINGAMEHCPKGDIEGSRGEHARVRCAVNAVGSFATFAVMAHMLAGAVFACEESMNLKDLSAICASFSSQLVHAFAELTAAAASLAEECPESSDYDDDGSDEPNEDGSDEPNEE